MNTEIKENNLTSDEQIRLDKLLSAARGFNYLSFVLAGLSLAISTLENIENIILPIGEVTLPKLQSVVGIYILVLMLTFASMKLMETAYPWMILDSRRIPFAWVALNTSKSSKISNLLWLILPLIICTFSTSISLKGDLPGILLSLSGFFMVGMPYTTQRYWNLIKKREDHRGGSATFSIYLLYWYRTIRQIGITMFLFFLILTVIPKWREIMLIVNGLIFIFLVILLAIRFFGTFTVIYRGIARLGIKLGFPEKSTHYK